MWPVLVAIGAYCIAAGIQEAIDENSSDNRKRLPGGNSRKRIADDRYNELTDGFDDLDYDDNDEF